ncbi:PREDICTED: protein SON-like isoform X1 [Amphimedon queenslandica]|uniref:Protein SON n=1 Tax=Amphimedon queenslandica TaxID=400682 RepID=A0AAN0IYB4_AMPQE|nr:PREDICTED: protein SON-like isoform X1 [Amphimedon queenslandica]XP_019849434.1 PREDICTED: protein SON-like isoform X1 [Amphimedon queenslandica]|eukprot:XP_019849433.1 PREDICTED: protein SON-like isoform X1 [Amphimedon queenslandica]
MGSSRHNKKHKTHKHKHKKHHHKSSHRHKRDKKRETSIASSMDEETLLHKALMSSESLALRAPSDDTDNSTDAATGQIDHSITNIDERTSGGRPSNDSTECVDNDEGTLRTGLELEGNTDELGEGGRMKSSSESKKRRHKSRERKKRKGSRERNRSRSRNRSRNRSRSRNRLRSRSRSRSRNRSRSRRRQKSRERRSRSRNRSRKSRSRSRKRSRRSRSRNRSRTRSRRSRSRTRSRSKGYSRGGRRSRSRDKWRSGHFSDSSPSDHDKDTTNPYASYPIPVIKTKADVIAEFTAFCRDLSHDRKDTKTVEQYHPFELKEETSRDNDNKTSVVSATQVLVDFNAGIDTRPVEMRFPVSAGIDHQTNDTEEEIPAANNSTSMSVSDIISERALIQQRLLINPSDIAAAAILKELDTKMSKWCQGNIVPGRYTGVTMVTPMDKGTHKMGLQAWAKKKMFYGLRPVREGFGMKMLKRMGWREGQPLGKGKEGYIEPIPVDVKTDRQGLSTEEDKKVNTLTTSVPSTDSTPSCLQGKHPVCALQELSVKKLWDPPSYEIVSETGPPHMRIFIYKVTVNGDTYQPSCGTSNKKLAKAQAALTCLKSLGLISNDSK